MATRRQTLRLGPDARRLISDAALELLREHGADATSLQMIADRLGVTKAAVYYHFKTKEEILLAAAGPLLAEADAFLDEMEGSEDDAARITAVIDRVIDFALRYRALLVPGAEGNLLERGNADDPQAFSAFWPRLVRLLAGPNAQPEDIIAVEVYLIGAGSVATGELRTGYSDEQLRVALRAAGLRLLLPVDGAS